MQLDKVHPIALPGPKCRQHRFTEFIPKRNTSMTLTEQGLLSGKLMAWDSANDGKPGVL